MQPRPFPIRTSSPVSIRSFRQVPIPATATPSTPCRSQRVPCHPEAAIAPDACCGAGEAIQVRMPGIPIRPLRYQARSRNQQLIRLAPRVARTPHYRTRFSADMRSKRRCQHRVADFLAASDLQESAGFATQTYATGRGFGAFRCLMRRGSKASPDHSAVCRFAEFNTANHWQSLTDPLCDQLASRVFQNVVKRVVVELRLDNAPRIFQVRIIDHPSSILIYRTI